MPAHSRRDGHVLLGFGSARSSPSSMAKRALRRTTVVAMLLLVVAASTSASQRQARRLPDDDAWPADNRVDNHNHNNHNHEEEQQGRHRDRERRREQEAEAAALADVARAVVARTASTSQVLSLNLTNLLILLVLKALLFGAGIFSFGLLGKQHYGRSAAPDAAVTEAELALALAFLSGEAAPGGRTPLPAARRLRRPHTAARYAAAASAALSALKAFSSVVEYNPRYEEIVSGMRTAVEFGKSGGSCADRYKCSEK